MPGTANAPVPLRGTTQDSPARTGSPTRAVFARVGVDSAAYVVIGALAPAGAVMVHHAPRACKIALPTMPEPPTHKSRLAGRLKTAQRVALGTLVYEASAPAGRGPRRARHLALDGVEGRHTEVCCGADNG